MVEAVGRYLIFAQADIPEDVSDELVTEFTPEKILRALFALFIAYTCVFLIQKITNWIAERVPRRYRLLTKQSLPFWKGLILLITIAYLVRLFFNLSESNLLALTGSIAVAVGFAFKDYISSIIAGVVALFESPYRVGDRIQIGDHYGEVVSYGLRGIQIQTPDDNTVTIPHNKAWTEAISNANAGNLEAQVATEFFFEHDADDEMIINILYQAAYSSKYTQLKLPIRVLMKEEEWGTKFKLRSYPMDARDEFLYQTDLIRRAKKAFARHNIAYLKRFSDFE
ncbi:MscS Mechanosensitive ion channel [Cyanobacterium stanieri PCC 7202]|uniref:MscS Mechanosensitive ion channel n=1 Tax=Cyanobacterium stanieri (strain ATCC 29140 / PCC 7202) TaxID=292563 RepID=K9YLC8_CYASC|nr:MscS Mechanosensitive ion channel [Cyanobacterium stanieri PCC 7202]